MIKNGTLSIISSFNPNNSIGPNSMLAKILKLLKDDICSVFSNIHTISFSTGAFSSVLRTAKVVPVRKMDLKVLYNRITAFLNDGKLIYVLQFCFRQNYSTRHVLINVLIILL